MEGEIEQLGGSRVPNKEGKDDKSEKLPRDLDWTIDTAVLGSQVLDTQVGENQDSAELSSKVGESHRPFLPLARPSWYL